MPPRKPHVLAAPDDTSDTLDYSEPIDLADFQEQALEGLGGAGRTLKLKNGDLFTIPHPMLLDDERQVEVELINSGGDLDDMENTELRIELAELVTDEILAAKIWLAVEPHTRIRGVTIDGKRPLPMQIRLARAALGAQEYERFTAGGGSANLFGVVWQQMSREMEKAGPKLPR
jgi:hypothetical protein